jgi:hypothetical protein
VTIQAKTKEFVVYLFGRPQVADPRARAAALAAAGITVVDWEPESLDVLLEFGLKAMVHQPTPELARQLAGHPALWGYFYCDEPWPEEALPPIAAACASCTRPIRSTPRW